MTMMAKQKSIRCIAPAALRTPLAFLWNLLLAYIAYWLCRLIYWAENARALRGLWQENRFGDIVHGAWMFDTSAILYTNALYALMMLLPLHWKERAGWQRVARWVFVVVNGLSVVINLADAAYFPYTGRRTTASVFSEFGAEGNLLSIFGVELLRHWYLVVAAVFIIWLLWKGYRRPAPNPSCQGIGLLLYYIVQVLCLGAFLPLCIAGMRGGFSHAVRPITISNANQYVSRPADAAFVLNTPFSLIRTWGKKPFVVPDYFGDEACMTALYTPLYEPSDSAVVRRKNVVIMIVESFGEEYINDGYAPFVDSLRQQSLRWKNTFCNGRKSIDAMPSILSSIPMFVEPFFLTPASMNTVGGLARELKSWGYHSTFFHGAENGSMGFQAFARATGFDAYEGRTEYEADARFGGETDFDGMWAIWDEPFLQYMATRLGEEQEPFLASVFTATSHHPYEIPEVYRGTFPEGPLAIHKCIRYTDYALRRFFEEARRQPWFENTIFVLTADHTNQSENPYYQTDLGLYRVPLLIFDPAGEMPRGCQPGIAQQIDIMPTVLGWLGYDRPAVAFGCDLLATPADSTWAVNYNNGIYQYIRYGRFLQFDGQEPRALYAYETDSLLTHNIIAGDSLMQPMTDQLKSIIQQYMLRMNNDQLVIP